MSRIDAVPRPDWLPAQADLALLTTLDFAIASKAMSVATVLDPSDLDQIADRVYAEVYSAIDSQVEIQVNKAATRRA